uniref:plasmalemma vesicle associated protein a isoform X2 n=1 Tax=Scatophagus argus TaxID=75038 RepID=UPI001ED7DD18|nr:plasmalemma vesicle associated protein a isoform X2 [Scatophagus argus]
MYSSGYSQVSKHSPQTQKRMQYHSKGKSCGYYMRIVFFFSSLIQSLIIVSLVLFLIYGKKQDSASTSRIQDLEESFSRLSIENVALRDQRKNLTTLLNSTLTEKARNDWDLANIRFFANISVDLIQDLDRKLQQCTVELLLCKSRPLPPGHCSPFPSGDTCGLLVEQLKARLELVQSNFTQTTRQMRREMDQMAKDRDNLNLETISLRRDKFTHEKEVEFCRQKCKTDFVQSLSGVTNVTKAFLQKINSVFPAHNSFHLTCPKQSEHLEQIRNNCSSLSKEVEDKFQNYLNTVGEQVSSIQSENSRLKAENWRLSEDYRWCSQNRTGLMQQHRQKLDSLQRKHDEDKERLLMDKMRLNGEIQVLDSSVKYKSKEAEHLKEQLKQLNMSCISRIGFGGGMPTRTGISQTGWGSSGGAGSSSSSSSSLGGGQPVRTGSGVGLSSFNKPVSSGTSSSSSSVLSSGSSSSSALGYNKPVSAVGAFSNYGPAGSNPNLGSSGTGSNKPPLVGRSSSTLGLASGSTGLIPNLSSTGTGSNKPTSNVRSTSGLGSSSGSTGLTNKSGSGTNSGLSPWFAYGSSNSGQSKTGSGTGKGTSSGNSNGGTGLPVSAGRTSGHGPVSVAQHLQDLQRLINPAAPAEKQDLSRMLG